MELSYLKLILCPSPAQTIRRFKKSFSVIRSALAMQESASPAMPLRLQVEVTDRCNFDCIMCPRKTAGKTEGAGSQELALDAFCKLIEEIRPVYVTLNGAGEPLLNPETPKFIRFCRSRRIMTSMPTNMLLMDKAIRQEIMENPPGHLSFSLHATDKELFGTITSSSEFERCVDNFEQLQLGLGRRKSRLWVFCVLQNANLDHYEEMFAWLKNHKMLKAFTLATVFLFGKDKERLLDVNKINQMLTRLRHDIQACQDKEKAAFLKRWEQEAVNLIQSSKMCVTGPCLIPWYSTYIKAGGEVTPCCYLGTEEFVMGNIRETPFAQIWNGRRYQEFRKHLKEDRKSLKICASCWTNQESLIRELRPFFFIKKGLA